MKLSIYLNRRVFVMSVYKFNLFVLLKFLVSDFNKRNKLLTAKCLINCVKLFLGLGFIGVILKPCPAEPGYALP